MGRKLTVCLVAASLAGYVFVFAGCGGDNKSSAPDTTTTATATTATATTDTTTTATTTTATTPTTEETDTTSTETTDTSTETSSLPDIASAENCKELADLGTKFAGAFSGTGAGDVEKTQQFFEELAAKAPSDLQDDFQTIARAWAKIAVVLRGVDLSSGQTPSADVIAKLQSLSTEIDQTKLTQASQNIAAWVTKNCTG